MTEFQELVKDAPKFASMERGELVAYAYAMHASGAKIDAENEKLRDTITHLEAERRELMKRLASLDSTYEVLTDFNGDIEQECADLMAENAKLRELVRIAGTYCVNGLCGKDDGCPLYLGKPYCALPDRMRELGIELNDCE